MNSMDEEMSRLGRALQTEMRAKRKLRLIGYAAAFRRKAMYDERYKELEEIAKRLAQQL